MFPVRSPMGGMMTSLTSDVTIFPNAPPMMMPTAISTTFPRSANFRNSFMKFVSMVGEDTILSRFRLSDSPRIMK
jgi:hypothetical protein